MPRYNCKDNLPPIFPCKVYDANGLEWRYVVEMDTDTGDLVLLDVDENGLAAEDPETQDLRRKSVKVAAPLLLKASELCNPIKGIRE